MKLLWFTAPWCRPCKNMVPVIDELQDELPGLLIEKINVSEADRGRPGDGLMVEFRDAAAKRAFRKAWLARTDGEYSFDLAAVIQQDGTIFVHGTDDVERAADLANEILGVKVEIYEES